MACGIGKAELREGHTSLESSESSSFSAERHPTVIMTQPKFKSRLAYLHNQSQGAVGDNGIRNGAGRNTVQDEKPVSQEETQSLVGYSENLYSENKRVKMANSST